MQRPRFVTEEEYKVLLGNMHKVGGGVDVTRGANRSGTRNGNAASVGVRLPIDSPKRKPVSIPAPPPQKLEYDSKWELVLVGQIKSGKNRILITRTGHRYPPKEFKAWRDLVVEDMKKQWKQPAITEPVRLHCEYWPGDRRTRDVSGMEDALFHVLVKAGVLKDDGLVWDMLWYRQPMNRKGPKVLITITAWGG